MASEPRRPALAIVGIGNPDRGDDAAGPAVAHLLRGRVPRDVDVIEHNGEATSLLSRLEGLSAAIMIDACRSGAPAGTVHRFEVHGAPMPEITVGVSTHDFGLATAIELARALGQLPRRCIVYAIEGESFVAGAQMSAPVSAAVQRVAQQVTGEICSAMAQ